MLRSTIALKLSGVPKTVLLLTLLAVVSLIAPVALAAQENSSKDQACLQCHGNGDFKVQQDGKEISLYVDYEQFQASVHAGFGCISCHPEATNIPHQQASTKIETLEESKCFACHSEAKKDYLQGSHAFNDGAGAQCTDCHGEHNVQRVEDAASPVNRMNIAETCTSCHQGVVKESYAESFHGKAVSLGSLEAASCVDCHGSHAILGPDNPLSPVAKANIPQTCAKCHNSPQANFADGKEHYALEPTGEGAPMYFTLKFFTWLTIITITLLIIHIELELFRKLRSLSSK